MSSTSPRPGGTRAPGTTPHAGARARLGYNGQLHEPRSCWQILGNGYRVYNPVLRRFHSPDSLSPFGEGGINAYAYCGGDPVNNVDPTGEFLMPIAMLMGIGAVGMGTAAGIVGVDGKGNEAITLGVIAAVLGATSMFAARGAALRPVRPVRGLPYKPQGALAIKQRRSHVSVSVHGGPTGTAVGDLALDGKQISAELRRHGVDGRKKIKFLSCHSGDEGAPQAQVISNEFNTEVKGYVGKVWVDWDRVKAVGPRTSKVFFPQSGVEREATAIRNAELHQQMWGHYRAPARSRP